MLLVGKVRIVGLWLVGLWFVGKVRHLGLRFAVYCSRGGGVAAQKGYYDLFGGEEMQLATRLAGRVRFLG